MLSALGTWFRQNAKSSRTSPLVSVLTQQSSCSAHYFVSTSSAVKEHNDDDEPPEDDEDIHKDFPLMGRENAVQQPMERAEVTRCLRLMPHSPWMRLHESAAEGVVARYFTQYRRRLTRTLFAPVYSHASRLCTDIVQDAVEASFDMPAFLEGASSALEVTYGLLGSHQYDTLRGLVTAKLLQAFRRASNELIEEQELKLVDISAKVLTMQPVCVNLWGPKSVEQFDPAWINCEAGAHVSRSWLVQTVTVDCNLDMRYQDTNSGSELVQASLFRHGHVLFARGPLPRGRRESLDNLPWRIMGVL
ncbi:hypothetical protein CEUSTIGMA_g6023.t1 [Chlamydomonas eustigma]|uniref:Tim44-like domain-containing protein n=1 Tax=Chlamydomonas eustigma TaxID=1157962 RepID=A0A250X677_9CHLO|nr:hypothetical protein CEUSTIGMA_g6023.t1 [Chlamydomonas eustigma]|eukprot:GAX78584.1 hypothetical protein CEUSTIGMA_g6023.t1 [Chlamydomonas eustigma]